MSHQRWIWSVQNCPNVSFSTAALSRILNTLTKLRCDHLSLTILLSLAFRIHEGFTFAHSARGIQNMVLEVGMEQSSEDKESEADQPTCVLQYIIFPPHTTSSSLETESVSDTEDAEAGSDSVTAPTEADGEVQIITEVWTEPQDGLVTNEGVLHGLKGSEIAGKFFPRDLEVISTLITFEHLSLMCGNPCVASPPGSSLQTDQPQFTAASGLPGAASSYNNNTTKESSAPTPRVGGSLSVSDNTNIKLIPFAFDLITLLPKSHQTELLFSLIIQVTIIVSGFQNLIQHSILCPRI